MKKVVIVVFSFALILSSLGTAMAAVDYPKKPITFIIPWGAGGMTDVSGRMLADKFKAELGQPIVVINKPGASGIVGLKYGLKQKADGYTVVVGSMTMPLTTPFFQGSEPFNIDDITFVGSYMPQERVLFTTPDKPYKTFQQFIDYAKKHPGEISVGSGGAQWALEVMKSVAVKEGLKLKYVMFKSGAAASAAILGKHVDVCETGTGTPAFQAAREGELILLVDLGSETVPYFPNVKNLKQLGYPYTTVVEYGLVVKTGTPQPIVKKLEATLEKVIKDPEIVEKMTKMGLTPRFLPGKEYERITRNAVKSVPEMIEYNKKLQQ
ncbi:MAG: tripartite tricarboxylate transporter substrate binding protein [Deltaproteobacteria bacterium]|nr:tripartite tricarboxylate transporter substrate binding protein [Deltaproteobacteria bacterium]MBW2153434.1 tripartite tricarboxylate transporter substrate binding protein [Deltaproteobacteria bacterium]